MIELAPSVATVTGRLIELLDTQLPGQLVAFYLVGSVALGDYREGRSDIDFVAVLDGDHVGDTLAGIHAALARAHPSVDCDGIYLHPGDLALPPSGTGIEVRGGKLDLNSAAERHPVTWLVLADHGIALRGTPPDPSWIAADPQAAIGFSRRNLEAYWRPWLESRRPLLWRKGLTLLQDEAVVWGCLGIARLHATIATGRVPSKYAAGEHVLATFPAHARVIRESLRLRSDPATPPNYGSRLSRRRDAIAFMDAVLASVG